MKNIKEIIFNTLLLVGVIIIIVSQISERVDSFDEDL